MGNGEELEERVLGVETVNRMQSERVKKKKKLNLKGKHSFLVENLSEKGLWKR